MNLGAHESVAGGLPEAFRRADEHGSEAFQVFTSSKMRWEEQRRDPGEVREFAEERARRRMRVLSHDSYLINLAAPRGDLQTRSRRAFLGELERSEALGIEAVVMHPGAHCGAGVEVGLRRVAAGIAWALGRTAGYRVKVLVELTAGQGTCLAASFEEVRAILDQVGEPARMGVCFDTCHAYAAGHDLRTDYEAVWRRFDTVIGLPRLAAFHLNDSKRDLGSRVDRHDAIGEGTIGDGLFRRLVRDPRFAGVPAVLELPPEMVVRGLRKLKGWRIRQKAVPSTHVLREAADARGR
jgi:deoxyribonuclease-4